MMCGFEHSVDSDENVRDLSERDFDVPNSDKSVIWVCNANVINAFHALLQLTWDYLI